MRLNCKTQSLEKLKWTLDTIIWQKKKKKEFQENYDGFYRAQKISSSTIGGAHRKSGKLTVSLKNTHPLYIFNLKAEQSPTFSDSFVKSPLLVQVRLLSLIRYLPGLGQIFCIKIIIMEFLISSGNV